MYVRHKEMSYNQKEMTEKTNVTCPCGSKSKNPTLKAHLETKRHRNWVASGKVWKPIVADAKWYRDRFSKDPEKRKKSRLSSNKYYEKNRTRILERRREKRAKKQPVVVDLDLLPDNLKSLVIGCQLNPWRKVFAASLALICQGGRTF
jgi:hypothetical protein